MKLTREVSIGSHNISVEHGHIAKQSGGSALIRCGDTLVLATVNTSGDWTQPKSFLPLTVEYREHAAAAGRIPGGFFKREGRPTEKRSSRAG